MARKVDMERVKKTLAIISSLIPVGGELSSPVKVLAAKGAGCAASVSRYLAILEKHGRIVYHLGKVRLLNGEPTPLMNGEVTPLMSAASVDGLAAVPQGAATAPVASSVEAVAPVAAPTPHAPNSPSTVVLVDLENVMKCYAVVQRASISFKKLFDALVHQFGPVDKADVFAPPHMSRDDGLVQAIDEAGFTDFIQCPKGHKDKDTVDAKMSRAGRFYAREANAGTIVIVSEDADFASLVNFVESRCKVAAVYRVSENPNLARDATVVGGAMDPLSNVQELRDAFRRRLLGDHDVVVAGDKPRVDLLKKVARAIYQMELRDGYNRHSIVRRSFRAIITWVRDRHPEESECRVMAAFTALQNESVVCQKENGPHKYYELTSTPALRRALELPVV